MAADEAETRHVNDAIKVVRQGLAQKELEDSVELMLGLMEYQFRAGDAAGANETLKKLQARGLRPGVEEFELARVLILEDKLKEAASSLEKAITHLQDKPAMVRQAHLLLGRCYAELGDHERRLQRVHPGSAQRGGNPAVGNGDDRHRGKRNRARARR